MGQISSSESKQLFKAAKQGKYDVVAELVGKNPSLVASTDWLGGQNVWHIAAIHGHLQVMKAVESALSQGPTGPDNWKPLLRLGHSLKAIMTQVVNRTDSRVRTPLHYACMNGHAECAAFLLELGADPWLGDMLGSRTCLHYAAAAGHPECIKVVLSKCAGPHPQGSPERPNRSDTQLVDARNSAGFAPIHYAVWACHADAVQALLSFEAYLFPRNISPSGDWIQCAEGCTPLHLAALKGNIDVAKVLLKAYAECMVLDSSTGNVTAVSRHRTNLPDPRLVLNGRNQLSFQIAQRLGNQAMAEILHPSIPFAFLFSSSDFQADTRMFGPCRLAVLAANALQQKLKQDIQAAVIKLQQHSSNPGPLKSASLEALLAKPAAVNGGASQGGLDKVAEQGDAGPVMSKKTESSPALVAVASSSGDASSHQSVGDGGEGGLGLAQAHSEPTPSPFRMDDSSAAGLFKSWGTTNSEAALQSQPSGHDQVKEVDVRMRVSSRRLLSLGSTERNPQLPEGEQHPPVEESVPLQTQYTLEDTLPFISGRLGGDKEAFYKQFRLLRLTAGVQEANWQMGQPLLPPQRTRSVPRPLPFKSALQRTNTDSPANLLALAQIAPALAPAHSDPTIKTSSDVTTGTGTHRPAANLEHRPPRPRISVGKKPPMQAQDAEDPAAQDVRASTPASSVEPIKRRSSSGARSSAFVLAAEDSIGVGEASGVVGVAPVGDSSRGSESGEVAKEGLRAGLESPARGRVSFDVDDEDEDEGDCEICMDKPLQLSMPGCNHKLCVDCASELCKLHHFRPALCPFCRAIISGFKPIGI